jgi:hypothetical protein
MIRTKRVPAGRTVTVETFWNATGTAFFRGPAGVKIYVKYGKGWLSVNRQEQTLDGHTIKKWSVGRVSIILARMRVKAPQTTDLTYDVYPGNVAIQTPEYQF